MARSSRYPTRHGTIMDLKARRLPFRLSLLTRDKVAWEGGYFSNDGARVTVEDARALGSALERALSDHDPVAVSPVQRIKGLPADLRELLGDDRDYLRGVLERLTSADTREELDRYVRFLKRGSFTIE